MFCMVLLPEMMSEDQYPVRSEVRLACTVYYTDYPTARDLRTTGRFAELDTFLKHLGFGYLALDRSTAGAKDIDSGACG